MSDVNEAVIRVRVLLHEAEVDVTMGEEDAAKTNLEEIRMMLDRLAGDGPLMPGGTEDDEALEEEHGCRNCYHETLGDDEEPCCDCNHIGEGEGDFWESKTPKEPEPEAQEESYKTCVTCVYDLVGQTHEPLISEECNSCVDKSNWETA